ncbi:MAG: superoxide dismutase [Fe] [Caulobacter sp.]|nr:superoxide dismutase [Fe] [Caulobacter sp.]
MFVLPDLPYAQDALEPVVSARTLSFHHGKHHKAYVDTLNGLLKDKGETPESLESVVAAAGPGKLFNNAAQAWNHAFFWHCMAPSPARPSGDLAAAIDAAFGDLDGLKTKFVETGAGQFGSGWAWLVWKDGALKMVPSHDAGTPIASGEGFPILVCDVWEHAYYLDHQNNRKGFLEAWFDGLANWDFAASQLAAAKAGGGGYAYPAPR